MNILLIEDSKTLQRIIGGYVKDAGHELEVAETGEIALQLLETQAFDLILSDVDMPGLGGFDTVTLIREMLGEHWVPIIFVTSRDEDEDYIEGFDAGADDYLVKPVREVVLRKKIQVMERFINMQNRLYEVVNQPSAPSQFCPLTSVYTNHSFLHIAGIQWAVQMRRQEPVSFIVVGVDYFDEYIERYGVVKSDQCLNKVAKAIQSALLRPNDFIGRINNNDFVLMLPATEERGANYVADRIVQAVENLCIEHRCSSISGAVSVSVAGVSASDITDMRFDKMVNKAAVLLHHMKFENHRRVCVHELN